MITVNIVGAIFHSFNVITWHMERFKGPFPQAVFVYPTFQDQSKRRVVRRTQRPHDAMKYISDLQKPGESRGQEIYTK